jgi:hypothetical protein
MNSNATTTLQNRCFGLPRDIAPTPWGKLILRYEQRTTKGHAQAVEEFSSTYF